MKRMYGMASVLASLSMMRGCGFSVSDAAADGLVSGISDTIATLISTVALGALGVGA